MGEGQYEVRVTQVTPAPGTQDVIGPNPRRVALIVSAVGASGAEAAVAQGWPGGEARYPITTSGPQHFLCKDYGPLVGGAWGLYSPGGFGLYYFTEIVELPRETPAAKGG